MVSVFLEWKKERCEHTIFEILFSLTNGVLFFWLVMMFLPKWKVTRFLVEQKIILLYLALLYTIGIAVFIIYNGFDFVQDFGSATGVLHLLSQSDLALLCWIHLLCFDMFVGHYIFTDNQRYKTIPLVIQSIILFLTLMFGPFGFLCYMVFKIRKRTKAPVE